MHLLGALRRGGCHTSTALFPDHLCERRLATTFTTARALAVGAIAITTAIAIIASYK